MSRISAMKRALVTTGIAALMLLTGCTNTTTSETVTVTPGTEGTYSDGDTTVGVVPLTAEDPTEAPAQEADTAGFVTQVRDTLREANVIPSATDEQLVQAGEKACEMKAGGTAAEDISVIDGEERTHGYFLDSYKIYDAAVAHLC